MNDARFPKFERRAVKDNTISHLARTIILRIIEWKKGLRYHSPSTEFFMSWRDFSPWLEKGDGICDSIVTIHDKGTIYSAIKELVDRHYLYAVGRAKSRDGKSGYRLTFSVPEPEWLFDFYSERGAIIWGAEAKRRLAKAGSDGPEVGGKIPPLHIRYSLREEMYNPKGRNSRPASPAQDDEGGSNGSLRSKASQPQALPSNWQQLKKAAGLEKTTV